MEAFIITLLALSFFFGGLGYCITSAWLIGPALNGMSYSNAEKQMPPLVRRIYNFCFWLMIGAIVIGFTLEISTRWLGIR